MFFVVAVWRCIHVQHTYESFAKMFKERFSWFTVFAVFFPLCGLIWKIGSVVVVFCFLGTNLFE